MLEGYTACSNPPSNKTRYFRGVNPVVLSCLFYVGRSLMFPCRRGASFGSQGIFLMEKLRFSTEKPRASKEQIRIYTKKAHISIEMIPIFTESRLLAMKQVQNSREKFDFYGVAMRLRRETACFYEEGL